MADSTGIVSIHAPTRGATLFFEGLFRYNMCFNPRAHAGRDPTPMSDPSYSARFNPRAHAGRDLYDLTFPACHAVSIHAPTRGATDRSAKGRKASSF